MGTLTKIKKAEVNEGKAKSYIVGDTKIVVCNIGGKYFAVEDVCSHDDGELVSGECELIESCQIECPRHGARFDVTTGEAKKMPAAAPIETYKIKVVGDELEVEVD